MAPISRPKAERPSKVVKPKKDKRRSTQTTRNHRFQPFSERIAKLKIDPIRRRRGTEGLEQLSDETETYLGRSLQEWQDLNLSQTFSAFVSEASPLCDSLPVVLHNEDRIMDLLVQYIAKGDEMAMEPLLSLLSHFAHDLDIRFEKHFERAVATVAATAAKHPDPAVIEWSFTCLAWLFKYLSRMLVPDLRPLYNLMSPYLGKSVQKPFIIRFTAESMGFLLRKTAATYERDPQPLDLFIKHILDDCITSEGDRSSSVHHQGVMTLLTETMIGVQYGIHSSAIPVLRSLMRKLTLQHGETTRTTIKIIQGCLTSVIHHTTAESFKPLLDIVLEFAIAADRQALDPRSASTILFTIISVRKGSRVAEWQPVVRAVQNIMERAMRSDSVDGETAHALLSTVAVAMQYASVGTIISGISLVLLRHPKLSPYFMQFCDLFARLGHERFQSLIVPHLNEFTPNPGQDNEDAVRRYAPELAARSSSCKLRCSPAIRDRLVQQLKRSLGEDGASESHDLVSANAVLSALPHFAFDDAQQHQLRQILSQAVQKALESTGVDSDYVDLSLSTALGALLDLAANDNALTPFWPRLCVASSRALSLPRFWANTLRFVTHVPRLDMEGPHMERLEHALMRSLALPSRAIRATCLEILQELRNGKRLSVPDALSTAIVIESTPLSLETSRSLSMNIRKLSSQYAETKSDSLLQRLIPIYCFGLLHIKLAQVWDDVVVVLAEICKDTAGEEVVIALAQQWLEGAAPATDDEQHFPDVLDVDTQGFNVASDFECPNNAKLTAIAEQVFGDASGGYPSASEQFKIDHQHTPVITDNTRTQALKVLHQMPRIAEKRSRLLVPVLLKWAGTADTVAGEENVPCPGRWSRKDQKAMLALFAQFTNPKVLYKSNEVYDALLNLCANGDVEIQRSALKAVLAWKQTAITRYEEHLFNLLDEARFREEISVFLHDGADEDGIRREDHVLLMPVLLRLLYGRAVAGEEKTSTRNAIFVALSRFDQMVLCTFVDIAVMSKRCRGEHSDASDVQDFGAELQAPLRQQLGMLNMLHDLLDTLGSTLEDGLGVAMDDETVTTHLATAWTSSASKIATTVLRSTISASRKLGSALDSSALKDAALLRSIRQTGMQALHLLYASVKRTDLSTEARAILNELVAPRLAKFASENTQSVSGMLRLFATWSASPATAQYLGGCGDQILPQIAGLLQDPTAKDEVRLCILQDILDNICQHGSGQAVLQPHVTIFARSLGRVLEHLPSKAILDATMKSLTGLSELISDPQEAAALIGVCTELLTKPALVVSSATKADILRTLLSLLDHVDEGVDERLYEAVCGLFSRLQHQKARILCSDVLIKICRSDSSLTQSATLCNDLNASDGGLVDEADQPRRDLGFSHINEQAGQFNALQWLPILHNCLFFIRDVDDLANRSSASSGLQQFIHHLSVHDDDRIVVVSKILYPAIERGMQDPSELVRAEYLRLLGALVKNVPDWPAVKDLSILAVDGDEEASVFSNMLHIQQHRRLRALRRLADEAGHISSQNTGKVFLPLLEHFVFDPAAGDSGRTLADQTVVTIGSLASAMNWPTFRSTFKRYTGLIISKEDLEKTVLRLLGVLVDSMSADKFGVDEKKSAIILRDFLPPLMEYLHQKDDSTVDRRMPVAVTIVKLLRVLPEAEMSSRLAPVLTDVCHVLRSKSQEARDQTRKALASILTLIGPAYLNFILKELRTSLQRGSQLHVLSYTVHSLLLNVVDVGDPNDLVPCLSTLMAVIMDDIFGVTGQEKDAEEYRSSMKEVKSSKSFDTMELLARVTPIKKLGLLVQPLRALLAQKLDVKMLRKADELLTRLRKGLDQNHDANSRDMLSFCHEMVRQVYVDENADVSGGKAVDYKIRKYLIKLETSSKSKAKVTTTTQMFKLSSFALNLVRKVIRRHEDLQTPTNMAGFLPIIGDALVQGQEEVKIAALRLLATIIRLPIPELETNAPIYIREAVGILKAASTTTTDASKAALELVTAVLKEKHSVVVRETDIAYLLKTLEPDIDQPDRSGIVYKFLRAVLGRKIVITEVYKIMDDVSKVMITNPDRHIRESARGAYAQFVLDYPQGKDRWKKQADLLVGNLRYEHPGERQSVMELLHQLLPKLGDDVLDQLAFTFFVHLIPVLVSDDDLACRQMAAVLLGKLFERAAGNEYIESTMRKWLGRAKETKFNVAALQCWAIYLRTDAVTPQQVKNLHDAIVDFFDEGDAQVDSELLKSILPTLSVLVEVAPECAFAADSAAIWSNVLQCQSSPLVEVQELIATLMGVYFSHMASSSAKAGKTLASLPLRSSDGLQLDGEAMRQACRTSLRVLMSTSKPLNEAVTSLTTRNLTFLGRCFSANEIRWQPQEKSQEDVDDGEHDDEDTIAVQRDPSALAYLLNRLSYIIRQDAYSAVARAAAVQCQASIVNNLQHIPNVQSIIQPLWLLTDPSIPQADTESHGALVDRARELLELLQKKVGDKAYVSALGDARNVAKEKRDERRRKRKIEAVSAPERWARDKKKKHDAARAKKKEKGVEARGLRRGW